MSNKSFSHFSRGATPAMTAVIVVLALAVLYGIYSFSTRPSGTTSDTPTPTPEVSDTTNQPTTPAPSSNKSPTKPTLTPTPSYSSVRTLLSKPNAMVCSLKANSSTVTQTLSIAKGKLRVDSRAGSTQTSYIYTASGSYMWSNSQDNKLIQGPVADAATSAILAMPAASFTCVDRIVSDNSFIPPAH